MSTEEKKTIKGLEAGYNFLVESHHAAIARATEIAQYIMGTNHEPTDIGFGAAFVTVGWDFTPPWMREHPHKRPIFAHCGYDDHEHTVEFPARLLWAEDWRSEYVAWKDERERTAALRRKVESAQEMLDQNEQNTLDVEGRIAELQKRLSGHIERRETFKNDLTMAQANLAEAMGSAAAPTTEPEHVCGRDDPMDECPECGKEAE